MMEGGAASCLFRSPIAATLLILILLSSPVSLILSENDNSIPNTGLTQIQDNHNNQNDSNKSPVLSQLVSSDPIAINGNDELRLLGFPGDGTLENPYVISGLLFSGLSDLAIRIKNTDMYFEITNNYFEENDNGIHFFSVKNGKISNNQFSNNKYIAIQLQANSTANIIENNIINSIGENAILIDQSPNNKIIKNEISNFKTAGIMVSEFSYRNFISENLIENGRWGISTTESDYSVIDANIIIATKVGILSQNSNFLSLLSNTIEATWSWGIFVKEVFQVTILYNIIDGPGRSIILEDSNQALVDGNNIQNSHIQLLDSDDSIVSNNRISCLSLYGFELSNSNNNFILHNTFENCELAVIINTSNNNDFTMNSFITNTASQDLNISDSGDNTLFNYNYYHTVSGPDVDGNGIVDQPISVGNKNNFDNNTSVEPENRNWKHFVLDQTQNSEVSIQMFQNSVLILWAPSIDSLSHILWYNLTYSFDENNWEQGGFTNKIYIIILTAELEKFASVSIQISRSHAVIDGSFVTSTQLNQTKNIEKSIVNEEYRSELIFPNLQLFSWLNLLVVFTTLFLISLAIVISVIYRKRSDLF